MNQRNESFTSNIDNNYANFFYCEKENNIFQNVFNINSNDLNLKNERLHIEPSKLFSFYKNNEEQIDEDLNNKNLILIGSGRIGRLPVMHSIHKVKNFSIICFTIPQLKWIESFVDETIYCNTEDNTDENYEIILNLIKQFSIKKNIDFHGVITYDDYCVLLCSRLANDLKLKGMDYNVSLKIKNKYNFRNFLKENKIFEEINYSLIGNNEIKEIINDFNYCLNKLNIKENKTYIIKDINGAGKNFVRKFQNYDQFMRILNEIGMKNKLKNKKYLIEDYFEGLEVDIDLIVQDSKIKFFSLSENFPSDEEYFIEIGGCTPSNHLNSEELDFIEKITQNMIEKLKIDNTCLHLEAKCRPKSLFGDYEKNIPFFPIEINLRMGAAEVFSFHIATYNYNLFYNSIKVALDIKIDKYNYWLNNHNNFCSSINFQAKNSGYIKEISFEKDFFEEKSLITIILYCKIGDFINIEDNKGNGYLGFMVAHSTINIDDSLKNLHRLLKKIQIKIESNNRNKRWSIDSKFYK